MWGIVYGPLYGNSASLSGACLNVIALNIMTLVSLSTLITAVLLMWIMFYNILRSAEVLHRMKKSLNDEDLIATSFHEQPQAMPCSVQHVILALATPEFQTPVLKINSSGKHQNIWSEGFEEMLFDSRVCWKRWHTKMRPKQHGPTKMRHFKSKLMVYSDLLKGFNPAFVTRPGKKYNLLLARVIDLQQDFITPSRLFYSFPLPINLSRSCLQVGSFAITPCS